MSTEPSTGGTSIADDVAAARAFGRFYTRFLGALKEGLLDSPFSLTEARTIYELANRKTIDATTLSSDLGLDLGYLSRVIKRLEKSGIVVKTTSPDDGRVRQLALTPTGQDAFAQMDAASAKQVEEALSPLSPGDREALITSMRTIQDLLEPPAVDAPPYVLRPPRPGDLGWVIQRHGAIYAREHQWDERFEGLVAEVIAAYVKDHVPTRERCWIAEVDGERAGCVFLMQRTKEQAQLRLLLVEQHARGLGIGRRLVAECTRFARQVGYDSILLWTNRDLDVARHLYVQEGYRLIDEAPYSGFGHEFVGENWVLDL